MIDYRDNSTYKIGIPDVSSSDDGIDRQKCVIIELRGKEPNYIIDLKRYIFNRLASGTQINNYFINNIKQILIQSFTEFFDDEFGKIQDQVKQNNSPTEDKSPFFVTYNVDLKQFQEHKNVVAEKLRIVKGVTDVNIKEVFFKPYTNENIIALINMQIRTMDFVKAINEYMRADASLYLQWKDPVLYSLFDSQMLSQYREEKPDKENIKNVEELISSEIRNFSDDWYDNESLISSSKSNFYFRRRQLIDKICNSLGNFISFISNNVLKLSFRKLYERYNKIRLYIRENEWIRVGISYTFLAIVTALFQTLFSTSTFKAWFQALF